MRGDLVEPGGETDDLFLGGALLRTEDGGCLEEEGGDVAGDHELDVGERLRRWCVRCGGGHGGEGTPATVGGRRAAAADDDAAGPGVACGEEELTDAGRVGVDGILVAGGGGRGLGRRPWTSR